MAVSRKKVMNALMRWKVGFLATVDGATPRVRPMAVFPGPGATLLFACLPRSGKVRQIERNPRIEFCAMDPRTHAHARLTGRARMRTDRAVRAGLWRASRVIKEHYDGPDDPNFAVIEVKLTSARYAGPKSHGYEKVRL